MSGRDEKKDLPQNDPMKNEGEGSRSGAEKYDRELADFEKTNDAGKLAEEAARDLDEDPDQFKDAEAIGRSKKQVAPGAEKTTTGVGSKGPLTGKQSKLADDTVAPGPPSYKPSKTPQKAMGGQSVPPQRPQRGTQATDPNTQVGATPEDAPGDEDLETGEGQREAA